MKGRMIYSVAEYEEPERLEQPEPGLSLSPLAIPQGIRHANKFVNCKKCQARGDCAASVRKLGSFARLECEQELRTPAQTRKNTGSMSHRILEVLAGHPEGMTNGQILQALGIGPDMNGTLSSALETLNRREQIRVDRSDRLHFRYFPEADHATA